MSDRSARRASLGEIFTRNFLILSTINLAVFFGFQMLNVGLPVYLDQLGADTHIIGLATTLMTITATLVRIFSGAILDRFGRIGVLIAGTAIILCSIVSFALFPIVGIILGLRLLHGIGWGLGSTASSTIAADIIPKRRFAEGMGYFAMTTAIASALAPAASLELVQGAGAIYMLYVSAGITALAVILAIILTVLNRKRGDKDSKPADKQGDIPVLDPSQNNYSGIELIFDRRAVLPGLLMFLINIGFGCITTFIALHAIEQGVGNVTPYFLVYAIVTLVSRPFIGKLIDRYGYRTPAILSSLCSALTMVVIGLSSDAIILACAGALGGLGIGTAMGTFQSMAVARVEPWRRGVATSTYMTAFDLGIAIGSLVGGVIAGFTGYTIMYFCVAVSPVVGCIVSAAAIKKGDGVNSSDSKQP